MSTSMVRALIMLAMLLAALDGGGCRGAKKAAGEPCTATGSGAAECESGVCLKSIQCANDKMIETACAGNDCSVSRKCSGETECVAVSGSNLAYCLPPTLCQ